MQIPEFDEIVETNDQTEARFIHLQKLRELVGNVYPNKFERSRITDEEDTITRLVENSGIKKFIPRITEGERPTAEIKDAANKALREFGSVRTAGRLATPPRLMGKAAFVHLSDGISRIQIYMRRDDAKAVVSGQWPVASAEGEEPPTDHRPLATVSGWEIFQLLDHGDFIGVEGFLFITNTGELSVHVEKLQFLAKALLPMPDKMHGIEDAEIKQRQRYVDLIGSSLQIKAEPPNSPPARGGVAAASADGVVGAAGGTKSAANESGHNEGASPPESTPPAHAGGSALSTREVFERRAKVISSMRGFLEKHGYIEVETPMLTPKATGAVAKPFVTHHNALDITLYARIAPELYLKRLLVGGFEKVYELNRNFRNEGISYKHNPEFTMLEFYCAYMDVNGMMDFCEEIIRESVQKATGGLVVEYEGIQIDFSKFKRVTMQDAIEQEGGNLSRSEGAQDGRSATSRTLPTGRVSALNDATLLEAFEERVEQTLFQPTFIIDFPKSISPLSKASPDNPSVAERFELFINGMEIANGFSELNDPVEQLERFKDQMAERERGDDEAMILDEDYIRALTYGMPPAAGIGIGIDRLVMLLTNRHSIRDVILFPHLRPEKKSQDDE